MILATLLQTRLWMTKQIISGDSEQEISSTSMPTSIYHTMLNDCDIMKRKSTVININVEILYANNV
jgi:hypothetical protein